MKKIALMLLALFSLSFIAEQNVEARRGRGGYRRGYRGGYRRGYYGGGPRLAFYGGPGYYDPYYYDPGIGVHAGPLSIRFPF